MIVTSLIDLIGHTPMLEVALPGTTARLLLKLERFNPGGSIKDRTALAMIEDAEQRGLLRAGGTIIEPTSGNTGVGLAWIGRLKGYRVLLTMPDTMSVERRSLLQSYGAELVLTPGAQGIYETQSQTCPVSVRARNYMDKSIERLDGYVTVDFVMKKK